RLAEVIRRGGRVAFLFLAFRGRQQGQHLIERARPFQTTRCNLVVRFQFQGQLERGLGVFGTPLRQRSRTCIELFRQHFRCTLLEDIEQRWNFIELFFRQRVLARGEVLIGGREQRVHAIVFFATPSIGGTLVEFLQPFVDGGAHFLGGLLGLGQLREIDFLLLR